MDELNTFHRICPISQKACRDYLCEHQCYMDEQECRKEEHHQKQDPSDKSWDELMEHINRIPSDCRNKSEFSHTPVTIHIHNTIENIILTPEEHHHRKHQRKPLLVLLTLINKTQYIMSDITLTLGATPKDGTFALLDTVTGGILTGVSFSKQAVGANSNPASATFAIDPADTTGNSVLPTPLAAGSGTIGFAATATYTDSTGATQTDVPFTIVKNFTVVLGADGVTLDIIF